jgi:HAD superfamily hydrolase (TIGR01509 family)
VSPLADFRPRAVIFDLDGTLADNMAWHARAFEAFARRHGLPPVTMELRRRIDGKRNSEIFPILFGHAVSRDDARRFEDEKERAYRELSHGDIRPTAGAVRLLDCLAARGMPVAVATSAPEQNVGHTLAEIGLADRFTVIARSDQVAHGKPAPDVFLHAAAGLGVDAAMCLAFEDAPIGVTAARAAGMRTIALTSTFTAEAFTSTALKPDAEYADFDAFLAGEGAWLLDPVKA